MAVLAFRHSPKTGKSYIGTRPSRKSIQRVCRQVSEVTSRRWLLKAPEERVQVLNRILVGWANYFTLGLQRLTVRTRDFPWAKA